MITIILVCAALALGWYGKTISERLSRPKEIKALNEQLYLAQLEIFNKEQELKASREIIADLYIQEAKQFADWQPHEGRESAVIDGDTINAEAEFQRIVENYFDRVLRGIDGYEGNALALIDAIGLQDAKVILIGSAFKDFMLMSEEERSLPCKTTRTERLLMYTLLIERFFGTLANQKPAA